MLASLYDSEVVVMLEALPSSNSLRVLNLRQNRMDSYDDGNHALCQILSRVLPQCRTLEWFWIRVDFAYSTPDDLLAVAQAMARAPRLRVLPQYDESPLAMARPVERRAVLALWGASVCNASTRSGFATRVFVKRDGDTAIGRRIMACLWGTGTLRGLFMVWRMLAVAMSRMKGTGTGTRMIDQVVISTSSLTLNLGRGPRPIGIPRTPPSTSPAEDRRQTSH